MSKAASGGYRRNFVCVMGRDPERNKIPKNNLWTGHAARASLASDKTAIMRRWQQVRKTSGSKPKPSPEKSPPGKRGHLEKHGGGLMPYSESRARGVLPTIQYYHGLIMLTIN
jgi:hypothetical protein